MSGPKISFVTHTRNDEYTEGMLARQQAALDLFIEQSESLSLDCEILFIEWNPPEDRPPLFEAMRWPKRTKHVSLRLVSVAPAFHRRYRNWELNALHNGAAVNAGLRRARGTFVTPKGADVFYSDDLVQWLAVTALNADAVYRCDRKDVSPAVLPYLDQGREAFLEACADKVIHHHARLEVPDFFHIRDLHTNASGDFMLMTRHYWNVVRGWEETKSAVTIDVDSIALHAAVGAGAHEEILPDGCRVYKLDHGSKTVARISQVWSPWWRRLEQWLMKNGYDTATQNRFRMIFNYPRRVWRGAEGKLCDSYERCFLRHAQRWAKNKPPFHLNGPRWGLEGIDLPERSICKAEWDRD